MSPTFAITAKYFQVGSGVFNYTRAIPIEAGNYALLEITMVLVATKTFAMHPCKVREFSILSNGVLHLRGEERMSGCAGNG